MILDFLNVVVLENLNDMLYPFLVLTKGINPQSFKKCVLYIQLLLSLFLLFSYAIPLYEGVETVTLENSTFWYTLYNLAKVAVFGFLIWWIDRGLKEGFDYYVVGTPVQTPLIEPNPNLDVKVVATPDRTLPGTRIQYTFTLTNVGNVKAENIVLTNRVPEYTEFVSSPRGIYRNGYVSWYNINLSPSEFIQVSYVALVDENLDITEVAQIINNEYLAYNAV
jgi:uncharacterized repeat protein (TIGR01451 family)